MKNWQHVSIPNNSTLARNLIAEAGSKLLWTFDGPMGSGKTTLIQAVCAELGVNDEITSPTFSLVNEYRTNSGDTLYHFDFYRITDISEVYDIGYEDYFFSGCICLIEWPAKIEELLQDEDVFSVSISINSDQSRNVMVAGEDANPGI